MKLDFAILILICISIAIVTVSSVNGGTAKLMNLEKAEDYEEEESGTLVGIVTDALSDIILKEYETANGMKLILGRVDNDMDEEKNIIVPVSLSDEKTLYYNLTLAAGKTWTYASINGVLILPHTPMIIDPTKTSYYPSGDQLLIKIEKDYEGVSEIQVYAGKPSIITAGTPVRWYYDYKSASLVISGSNQFKEIMLYFSGFVPSGTVFLEDTRNIEELSYRADKLEENFETMNTTLSPLTESISNMTAEIEELELRKENVTAETQYIKKITPLTNRTIDAFEGRIAANVVLSPSSVVITVIIALILIVVIIDAMLLTKTVKK